jgi:hypothetical protein
MFEQDVSVQFHGFDPSKETRYFLKCALADLYEESPYGSVLKAQFFKINDLYEGVIHIASFASPFFVSSNGYDLKQLARDLIKEMRRKLRQWKSHRFANYGHTEYWSHF